MMTQEMVNQVSEEYVEVMDTMMSEVLADLFTRYSHDKEESSISEEQYKQLLDLDKQQVNKSMLYKEFNKIMGTDYNYEDTKSSEQSEDKIKTWVWHKVENGEEPTADVYEIGRAHV